MSSNIGKEFEVRVKDAFLNVPGVSVDRLHDQTNGFAGSWNPCDFIVYKYPYEYYIECKTVNGISLPVRNVTKNQREGLLQKAGVPGVFAGIVCWWRPVNVTKFIPIWNFELARLHGNKHYRYDWTNDNGVVEIHGRKKRVFFEYDMGRFFEDMEKWNT